MRNQIGLSEDQKTSLRYALPYLVFVGIPVVDIVRGGVWGPIEYLALALLAVMTFLYVYLWTSNEVAPVGLNVGPRFWVPFLLLVLVVLAMTLWGGPTYPGLVFMWAYTATPWVLLSPRRLVFGGTILLLASAIATGLFAAVPLSLLLISVLVMVLSGAMVFTVRREADRYRIEDSKRVADHQLELERERSQMNSDLHDILGQDLTGLSIKADLAVRLLEAGRHEEARSEMQSVADLARAAMTDVRGVVVNRREWSVDRELANAEDLLAARGIMFHLDRKETAFPGQVQGGVARVIRESTTNLLRHAQAANCWVSLAPERLTIRNDGCFRTPTSNSSGEVGGLAELKKRVQDSGQLHWNQEGLNWIVAFDIESNPDERESP
ncbi:histidine kinase [Actinomycetaceae bacterium MB13-C1-2]|nr:histidine kinase [Actinomycetaceae bacterium MB13-C1-2]